MKNNFYFKIYKRFLNEVISSPTFIRWCLKSTERANKNFLPHEYVLPFTFRRYYEKIISKTYSKDIIEILKDDLFEYISDNDLNIKLLDEYIISEIETSNLSSLLDNMDYKLGNIKNTSRHKLLSFLKEKYEK